MTVQDGYRDGSKKHGEQVKKYKKMMEKTQ